MSALASASGAVTDDRRPVTETALARIDGSPPPLAPKLVSRDEAGRVTLKAIQVREAPRLDGYLEDAVYRRYPPVSDFVQQEPREGLPATETTDVWVFFDREYLYIAARCQDSRAASIVANEMRRDNQSIDGNDNFSVILDTFYDRRNGFLFKTNPLGALADAQVTDERNANYDWNTVWNVKTAVDSDGWTVEMRIPFKSLRYAGGGPQVWGINFRRVILSSSEWSYLTPIPASFSRDGIFKLSSAATLVGIEPPERNINLELKPYFTGGLVTDREASPSISNQANADVGFDVKYGLTRSLITDFTYNTDFAQVEDDDAQVNLTRFSLFFPEKREFFLEGQGIFDFGGRVNSVFEGPTDLPILFFSRRIGLNDGESVPIQAGARMTGRAGAYSLGLLNIQTESLNLADASIPSTNFSVVRLKRNMLRRSNIGVIATHRTKGIEAERANSAFGFDGNLSFFENLNIHTYYARTKSAGLDLEDQESYRGALEYNRDLFGLSLEHLVVGGNFDPEVGFVRRDDIRKNAAAIRFSRRPKSVGWLRKIDVDSRLDIYQTLDGELETRSFLVEGQARFETSDFLSIQYTHQTEVLFDPFEIATDMYVPAGAYTFDRLRAGFWFGRQRPVSGWLGLTGGTFFHGDRVELTYWGRLELSSRWLLEPRISLNWIDLPEGRFNTNLVGARTSYAFGPRVFVTALIQYDSSGGELSSNLRFKWEYEPGSDLFVVYSDGRSTLDGGFPSLENRSLIVKLTRLFRF